MPTNLKIPLTIFCSYPFQILLILKTPLFILISMYIKIIIQIILIKIIIQIGKHKAKYIITACIPIIIIKNFLLFFFIIYKNERKEHKFWQQNYQKKNFYNKNIKIFKIFKSILMLIKY